MFKLEADGITIWAVPGRTRKSRNALLKVADRLEKTLSISIQLIDADKIFGADHLRAAFEKAARAFSSNENLSESISTEVMLYLSGCRQIQEALEVIGLADKPERIIVIVDKELQDLHAQFSLEEDDSVLSPEGKDIRCLRVADAEIATVKEDRKVDLVLEKVASLDIKKK